MSKVERQAKILELVSQRHLSTQFELAQALHEAGIDAVQATVSRDIAQLGLVKVRNADGRLVYALPGADDLVIAVVLLQPRDYAARVEAAGIREHRRGHHISPSR